VGGMRLVGSEALMRRADELVLRSFDQCHVVFANLSERRPDDDGLQRSLAWVTEQIVVLQAET
jgi:hypothetical protein